MFHSNPANIVKPAPIIGGTGRQGSADLILMGGNGSEKSVRQGSMALYLMARHPSMNKNA
jgi:hypothetical protein